MRGLKLIKTLGCEPPQLSGGLLVPQRVCQPGGAVVVMKVVGMKVGVLSPTVRPFTSHGSRLASLAHVLACWLLLASGSRTATVRPRLGLKGVILTGSTVPRYTASRVPYLAVLLLCIPVRVFFTRELSCLLIQYGDSLPWVSRQCCQIGLAIPSPTMD